MKCIHCGVELPKEAAYCFRCGTPTQIVPDYSIYDDDNIHVLMEGISETEHSQIHKEEVLHTTEQKIPITQEQYSKFTTEQSTKPITISKAESSATQSQNNITKTENTTESIKKQVSVTNSDVQIKQQDLQKKKQQQSQMLLGIVVGVCVLLLIIGISIKVSIDYKNENSFAYQVEMAEKFRNQNNLEQAAEYYIKAIKLNAKNVDVKFELAEIYFSLDKTTEAVTLLETILKQDAYYKSAYEALIEYYEEINNVDAIFALMDGITDKRILSLFEDYIVNAPSVNLKSGTYKDYINIALSGKMNTTVYYTLDGSDPRTNGTLYYKTISISEMGNFTLKAVCKNKYGIYSEVVTELYRIEIDPPEMPHVSPDSGTYETETYISIRVPNGCSAYYTWDNSIPTEDATLYAEPILIPEGRNQILSVIVIDNNTGLSSRVYRGSYDYVPIVVDTTEEVEEDFSEGSE